MRREEKASFQWKPNPLRHSSRYAPKIVGLISPPRWKRGIILHCMNDPQPEGHMAGYIRRRKFLATLGGAAAWPLAVRAQQSVKLRTIGFSGQSTRSAESELGAAFTQRLRELGWIDCRTITIENGSTEVPAERLVHIAAEFVGLKVDCMGTPGRPAASGTSAILTGGD